mgnify:CR=1 FL=1
MARKKKKTKQIVEPKSGDDRQKALKAALSNIEKDMGKGAVMFLGEQDLDLDLDVISTGALSLDIALGIGGLPKGRIVEIYGPESSGKTTVALHVVAEAQKDGGIAAFIDAEHALDPQYAKHIGVDIDNLIISQPDNGEDALDIAETLARSGAVDVIVVDSVAALVPRAEVEGTMDDQSVGVQARLMSKGLRKLAAAVSKSDTLVIFINQLREKIGIMFGNPETTTGGRALKFWSSVRLDVRRIDSLRQGDEFIGARTRVKVVKSKVSAPFREAEFDILYGEGISNEGCILDMAADIDVVTKSGSWYSYGDERMGQGRDNARQWLKDNPEKMEEIEEKVYQHFAPETANDEEDDAEKEESKDDKKTQDEDLQDVDDLLNLDL